MLTISLHLPESLQTKDTTIVNFNDWESFGSYIRRRRIQESYTVIFGNLDMMARKERIVSPSRNNGYWLIELMERNV